MSSWCVQKGELPLAPTNRSPGACTNQMLMDGTKVAEGTLLKTVPLQIWLGEAMDTARTSTLPWGGGGHRHGSPRAATSGAVSRSGLAKPGQQTSVAPRVAETHTIRLVVQYCKIARGRGFMKPGEAGS